jgi:hypothetical protein
MHVLYMKLDLIMQRCDGMHHQQVHAYFRTFFLAETKKKRGRQPLLQKFLLQKNVHPTSHNVDRPSW